jgi:hypothetical protein
MAKNGPGPRLTGYGCESVCEPTGILHLHRVKVHSKGCTAAWGKASERSPF